MKKTALAWLFDIDGVITDIYTKKVVEKKLFSKLEELLTKGQLVCFNSGRSLAWMQEKIIAPLQQQADKSIFSKLFVVGEKGGVSSHFDPQGGIQKVQDRTKFLPKVLTERVKQLVAERYTEAMFFDPDKNTMISIEMHDGYALDKFHEKQQAIIADLQQLLTELKYEQTYTIDPSNISTDIERLDAGKGLGAKLFLEFLNTKDIAPEKFITFGDSRSDFAMSDELWEQDKEVEMVYVGDREKLGSIARRYEITFVSGYSHAVLEYLQDY